MSHSYSSPAQYPITVTMSVGEVSVSAEGRNATERVEDFLNSLFTHEDVYNLPEEFRKDIRKVVMQSKMARLTLEIIAKGKYTSTDENPQYVGGVVSEGNRILTPVEGAQFMLDSMASFD